MQPSHLLMADYVSQLTQCLHEVPVARVALVAERIYSALEHDRLVTVAGNGGSAATASHLAADLGKTVLGADPVRAERRLRVLALNDNVPVVTAYGNDVGYATVFAEQLKTWARSGDLLIAISVSGNSPNIVEVIKAATALDVFTIGFLGRDGGQALHLVNYPILVPSANYGQVEDLHMIFCHMITAYVRDRLAAVGQESAASALTASAASPTSERVTVPAPWPITALAA